MATPTDQVQVPLYTDGSVAVDEYTLESGVCVLPLAEDPPTDPNALATYSPVRIMRLHAPYRLRRARGRADKQNNPPVIPAPTDSGKFVFLGGDVSFANSLNSTLVTSDWTVLTDFLFVENCVSRNDDGFVLTGAPWTWMSTNINLGIYPPSTPTVGAISQANFDARIGYTQGQTIAGNLNGTWEYNTTTFFPGSLLSQDMINGGIATTASLG